MPDLIILESGKDSRNLLRVHLDTGGVNISFLLIIPWYSFIHLFILPSFHSFIHSFIHPFIIRPLTVSSSFNVIVIPRATSNPFFIYWYRVNRRAWNFRDDWAEFILSLRFKVSLNLFFLSQPIEYAIERLSCKENLK